MEIAIRTEVTPASIVANFEEVRKHLETELEKYDVVVTAETLSDCKKLATDLNKLRGEIDTRRKEEVAKASEPVRQFDERMKELVSMCKDGRQKLLDQIERFDAQQLEIASGLLSDYLQLQIGNADLREEFSDIKAPAAKLTSLTPKGNLTAAAKAEVDALVSDARALQDRTDKRLTDLELECRRAGMDEPLQRQHIEAFLFADDAVYQSRLESLISTELERVERIRKQEAMKAEKAAQAAAEKAEADARRREAEAAAKAAQEERERVRREIASRQRTADEEQQTPPTPAEDQPEPPEPVQPEPQSSGVVRIQAQFEVQLTEELAAKGFTPEKLMKAFESKLVKNGFGNSFRGARLV